MISDLKMQTGAVGSSAWAAAEFDSLGRGSPSGVKPPTPGGDAAADPFRVQATQVLARLRLAIERTVYPATGPLQNSRTLQHAFKVDLNVSWQIYKLLGAAGTLSTVTYVPAAVSFKKLLAAANKHGAAEDVLAEAAAAYAAFEQLVSATTGDREHFETAVMSFGSSPEAALLGIHYRKAAFKADAHFFGVACDTLAFALLFHPGERPGTIDLVGVRQMLGLRRLRAGTDLLVERWKLDQGEAALTGDGFRSPGEPLDPAAAAVRGAAVLPEFCSWPVLPLATYTGDSGDVSTVLRHRDIGVGREVDITTGRVYRDVQLDRLPDGRTAIQGLVEIARPTRVQVIDTLVHRPTWPALASQVGVYAKLPRRDASTVQAEGVRLPFPEAAHYLGPATEAVRFPESPRYPALVRYACAAVGWRLDDMDLYRIRLDFPLMDSNVFCCLATPPV